MKKNVGRVVSLRVIVSIGIGILVVLAGSSPGGAEVASVDVRPDGVTWESQVDDGALALTVSGPGSVYHAETFPAGAVPVFGVLDDRGEVLPDGTYTWEIKVIPDGPLRDRNVVGESQEEISAEPLVQSGYFSIMGGAFVIPKEEEELAASAARAVLDKDPGGVGTLDVVHLDDVIVDGSLCVGFDCVNGEAFGADTIRLKENQLRIHFDDTSTTGFPNTDWRIYINDTASGGAGYFGIVEQSAGTIPFRVEAGARNNALYVESDGDVGIGTANPVVELHVVTGNTPTARLEQDGTSGFSPQTWDLAGNETNFFVRDVTGGSALPFRVQPGTPSNTLTLRADGSVGVGTWSPSHPLHLQTTGENAVLAVERTSGAKNIVQASDTLAKFGTQSDHPLRLIVNSDWKMELRSDNSVEMRNGATLTSGGVWTNASSRESKEDIRNLDAEEALAALEGLNPVKFYYKAEAGEEHLGFVAEDVPELVAMGERKGLSTMDLVAVLAKVAQEQQRLIREQRESLAHLSEKLKMLEVNMASSSGL